MSGSLTIATPCYNESESLRDYFKIMDEIKLELKRSCWKIEHLLIDDGSQDNTLDMLKSYSQSSLGVSVVRHAKNRGYGATIKTAMALCRSDWLIFVDADSNYDPRVIIPMTKKMTSDVDVINVSIFAPGGRVGFPWYRKFLSLGVSFLYRFFFPNLTKGIYTMTCGFRAYKSTCIKRLFPEADDFFATAEILLRAAMSRLNILEYPANNYRRHQGRSKMRVARNLLGHLKLLFRARLGKLGELTP